MNENLHNIDDLFRNSLDGHSEEVPPEVWKNIDHDLDKKQAAVYKRKYFFVRAAAMLLLLIGGITVAAILYHRQQSNEIAPENTVVTKSSLPGNKSLAGSNEAKTESNKSLRKNKDVSDQTLEDHSGNVNKNDATNNNVAEKNNSSEKTLLNKEEPKNSDKKLFVVKKQDYKTKRALIEASPQVVLDDRRTKTQHEAVLTQVTQRENTRSLMSKITGNTMSKSDINPLALFPTKILNNSTIALASSSSASGNKSINKSLLRSWSLSPMYAQNIDLKTLKDDDHFRDPRNNSDEAKRTEQETTSFQVGIGIQKNISNRISLQTGVLYYLSQTSIEPKTIFATPDGRGNVHYQFNCSLGNSYFDVKTGTPLAVGDSIETNYSKTTLSYLQIPLLISYKINFGKFSFLPTTGVSASFLLRSKVSSSLDHSSSEEEVSGSIDGLRSRYFSAIIQPEISYKLNNRLSIDLNPNVSFSLSPINNETAVKTYQNLLSIGAGLRIKL